MVKVVKNIERKMVSVTVSFSNIYTTNESETANIVLSAMWCIYRGVELLRWPIRMMDQTLAF
jgi:hypothetical protein